MARNILISRRNWVQQAAILLAEQGRSPFSRGSWRPRIPLDNLLDHRPQKFAEAVDNKATSTWFDVDLAVQRTVKGFGFQNLRTTSLGTMRLRASTAALDLVANGTTASGNAVLHFADTAGVVDGMSVENRTNPLSIPSGRTVLSHTGTTVTMNGNAAGDGVAVDDEIHFRTDTFDTGLVSSWPQDSTPFDFDAWGNYTTTGLYDSEEYVALGMPRYFIPSTAIDCLYIRCEFWDTTAVAPMRIGCFGAYEMWEPPYNFSYDWSVAPVDESTLQSVPGGSTYIERRAPRRRMNFGFNVLPQDEFLARSFGLGLIKGKSQPVVVVPFPDAGDVASLEKLAIYGLFSSDPTFSNPYFALYKHAFQLDQLR